MSKTKTLVEITNKYEQVKKQYLECKKEYLKACEDNKQVIEWLDRYKEQPILVKEAIKEIAYRPNRHTSACAGYDEDRKQIKNYTSGSPRYQYWGLSVNELASFFQRKGFALLPIGCFHANQEYKLACHAVRQLMERAGWLVSRCQWDHAYELPKYIIEALESKQITLE